MLKAFTAVIYYTCNKLQCLSLASHTSLDLCLWVRPQSYPRVQHLGDASLGKAPAY
jgi:hypothetical protein